MVANGSRVMRVRKRPTGAENQHDSNSSHSVSVLFGRTLNQRVPGSSPGRLTRSFNRSEPAFHPSQAVKSLSSLFGPGIDWGQILLQSVGEFQVGFGGMAKTDRCTVRASRRSAAASLDV